MKDHLNIGHLTKYDAFRANRDQVLDLEIWFKIHTNVQIRDICMDFKPYFKVHNLVSAQPKSIILGQMTNVKMVFHEVVSVYRLVKI